MVKTLVVNVIIFALIVGIILVSTPFYLSIKDLFQWLIFSFAPVLLPLMFLQSILFISKGFTLLAFLFQRISSFLLGIDGFSAVVVIASIIGGFPMTAILASDFIVQKKITQKQGLNLIYALMFPSFSFLNGVLHINGPLLIAIWVPSLIFLRFTRDPSSLHFITWTDIQNELHLSLNFYSLSRFLMHAVKESIYNLVKVSGIIVLFSIPTYFSLEYFSHPYNYWISAMFDFSRPSYLYWINSIYSHDKAIAVSMLSWGGLSMWLQVVALCPFSFSMSKFIKTRAIHSILTFLWVWLVF